jgi:hypothetical protein
MKLMGYYVLLCRHGPHENGQLVPDEKTKDEKTKTFPSQSVAQVLRERLWFKSPFGDEPIRLRQVLYAPALEVRQTTGLLGEGLGRIHAAGQRTEFEVEPLQGSSAGEIRGDQPGSYQVPACECPRLSVAEFIKPGDDSPLAKWLLEVAANGDPVPPTDKDAEWAAVERPSGNAVLVVGHLPHLSWLSDALLRRGRWWKFRSFAVPFSRAELVCLRFQAPRQSTTRPHLPRRGRVLWTITPDDKQAAADVRDKIRSKMETAKLLSGVITFALGALLALLLDPEKWKKVTAPGPLQVASGLLLAALVLYLATMYAYDRLLMPDRFWGERRPRPDALFQRGAGWLVQRPPSSAAWVLYVNMMRVWRGLFTTATACVVAALAVLSATVLHLRWLQLLLFALPATLAVALLVYWFRPVLGSED